MTKEIEGLVIRVIDYKESSLIMYLLTESHIESIICKGIKKTNSKFKGYVLSYNYVKCIVTDSTFPTLTDITVISSLSNIQNNLNKNKYAGSLINLLYKEKYENNNVYGLALQCLRYINDSNEEYHYNVFLLKNLYYMGIGLSSGEYNIKDILGYNIAESTIVTKDMTLDIDLNKANTIKLFDIYLSKIDDIIDINLEELYSFLKKYYYIHASIKI